MILALSAVVVLSACPAGRAAQPDAADAAMWPDGWPDWPAGPLAKQVDILVVLPEGSGTLGRRERLLGFFRNAAQRLLTPGVGAPLPDVQIGFLRSRVAMGDLCSYETEGDGGQRFFLPAREPSQLPEGLHWPPTDGTLRFVGGVPGGFPPDFWEAWSEWSSSGSMGCDVNQYLEAIDRALDGRNPAFPRPGALLVTIVLADRDECSLADVTLWPAGVSGGPSPTGCYLGILGLLAPLEPYAQRIAARHDGPMLFVVFADCTAGPVKVEDHGSYKEVQCDERCLQSGCVIGAPRLCSFPTLFAAQSPRTAGLLLGDDLCLYGSKSTVTALVERVLAGAVR